MRYFFIAVAIIGMGVGVQQAVGSAASKPNACGGKQHLLNEPGASCQASRGYCTRDGAFKCVSKEETACITGADWREVCDGKDNDCNGLVDDRIICGCGNHACTQDGPPPRKWDPESRRTDNLTL